MIVRAPHLQDERLYECYYAERRGDVLDPPTAEHLSDCTACSHRFDELSQFMTALRNDADAEVDALFPPDKLRAQQQDIARRVEHIGRPARVISFPGRLAVRQPSTSTVRLATRWIAAAAAAGLFVGVAAGTAFNFGGRLNFSPSARVSYGQAGRGRSMANVPSHLVPPHIDVTPPVSDDAFMSDLESALDSPHTRELVVFDALTPHVREIVDIRDFTR